LKKRIAIVGLGVAGSYLLNRLSRDHEVVGYERQKEGQFQAVCLVPETEIITSRGVIPICEVKEGDLVLTHKGRFRRVKQTFSRTFSGALVKLTPKYTNFPIRLTPEHPIRVTKYDSSKGGTHPYEWVPSGEIRDPEITKLCVSGIAKSDETKTPIHPRLIGYYLAEGYSGPDETYFYFAREGEEDLIDDTVSMLKSAGFKCHVEQRATSCAVVAYSLKLADIFRQFGCKSYEKHIPLDYLNLSQESITDLLLGLIRGDGCRTKDGIAITTSSLTLAVQVQLLLRRLGILVSVRQDRVVSGDTSVIDGRTIQRMHASFRVDINGQVNKLLESFGEETLRQYCRSHAQWIPRTNNFLVPIRKYEFEEYTGLVYNMEVEEDNSYQTIVGCLHNCAWGSSKHELSKIMKPLGIDFQKYILFNGKKMNVDLGNGKSRDIPLKGLVTFDKHQLELDLTEGKKVHFGVKATPSLLKDEKYDMIIDCTGLHRAFLPKIKNDMWVPCVEYKVNYPNGKTPFEDFFIRPFNHLCVTPETLVLSNPGAKQIQAIKHGETVLTREGFTKVKGVFSRLYEGQIIQITPYLFNFPVGLTPQHLVWTLKAEGGEPGWKQAQDIRECHRNNPGDYVCVPLPTAEPINRVKLSDYVNGLVVGESIYSKGRNQFGSEFPYKRGIRNELDITEEVAEFFGYYISEGSAFNNGIIVSNTNPSLLARMKYLGEKIFNVEGKEYWKYQIQFNSKILRTFFTRLFGEGALNKEIPHCFLGLPKPVKLAMIKGMMLGDGCKDKKEAHEHMTYTTRSRQLAFGLWQLLLSVGIVASVEFSQASRSMRLRIHGQQLQNLGNIFGKLRLAPSSNPSRKYKIKDGKLYLAVRNVSKKHFKGNVYDLETNGSFTTSFLVHNSGYFWYFPLEKGSAFVGAGDFKKEQNEFVDKFNAENPGVLERKIGRPIRISPPKYCEPFYFGNVVGCGESIGTVFPLLGEGIIPSLQCAQLLCENLDNLPAYRKEVLKKFEYFNAVYDIINLKLQGKFSMVRQLPMMLKVYREMKKMEDRFGLEVRLNDFKDIFAAY
jgi:intein/homing endonuclease